MSEHPGSGSGWWMWKRFLIGSVVIAVLAGAVTATAALEKVSQIAHDVFPATAHISTPKGLITPIYDGSPQTFLLIGSDRRAKSRDQFDRLDPPHSDTLLLVRLDPTLGQTSVLSIPRDLLVSITDERGRTYYPEKVNAAYTLGSQMPGIDGGARLAAETIKRVLGIKLNGLIDATFGGFTDVVDSLGCVYVNIDHRYFNQNLGTVATNYASINLQPGYQKLCYTNALDYVRYRHTDSDFVRVARQQDFLRDVREQVSVGNLVGQIDKVSKAVGRAITTNFPASAGEIIQLSKLIAFSQQKPLRQVHFQTQSQSYVLGGTSYVTATPAELRATVQDFLYGNEQAHLPGPARPAGHRGRGRGVSSAASGPRMVPTTPSSRAQAASAAAAAPFPLLFPSVQTPSAVAQEVHSYQISDQQGHGYRAYVAVFQQNGLGGYYDVEGMNWLNPPIIQHPTQIRSIGSRRYLIYTDGGKVHMIAWKEHGALYWVNNTLLEDLSNQEMLAVAQSAQPLR